MKKQLLSGSVIYADETVVQVLKEEGKTPQSESRMWVYGCDGRSGKAIRIFEYQPDRTGERCKRFLSSFNGYLVTDGYAGYNAVENVTRCGCWAHMRRAWRDAMPKGATTANSKAAVGYNYCNKLFALERKWKELNNAQRLENRRNSAEKLVDEYFLWVRSVDPVSGSKLDDAVKYALNQEKYLKVFLRDGNVPIDNSASERAIRPFCLGKKNWVLINSIKGANASAICYSLAESAKANGLKPYFYFKHLLTELPKRMDEKVNIASSKVEDLLPWSKELPEECYKRR